MASRPEFILRLRAERIDQTDRDGVRRLRAALKTLLRSFGLRALSVLPAQLSESERANTEGKQDG